MTSIADVLDGEFSDHTYKNVFQDLRRHCNMSALVHCPYCLSMGGHSLEAIIVHLNDEHLWTREEIADWLDTLDDIDITLHPAVPPTAPRPWYPYPIG